MLTNLLIEKTKVASAVKRLSDGRGMWLEVHPTGGRRWRFKYHFGGRERRMSLGVYPDVSLSLARERRDEARRQIAAGIDPSEQRKALKGLSAVTDNNTFEAVGREWFAAFSKGWAETHRKKVVSRLEQDLYPWLGKRVLRLITAPELLGVIKRIDARGADETARRALQDCGRIFRYGVVTGRADRDPSRDLAGALPPRDVKHFASITDPKRIGGLLRAIDDYEGGFITRCALRLAPHVFVRPGELRAMMWSEICFDSAEWRIPPERMKMREMHIVPLSTQASEILRELRPLTGKFQYVFPGVRCRARPMSENTVNAALRSLGYTRDEITGHGFRSMASTLLNEQGWSSDAIERQLAHGDRDDVRASYNFAKYLPERRRMMQAWSDYLYALRTPAYAAGSATSHPGSGYASHQAT